MTVRLPSGIVFNYNQKGWITRKIYGQMAAESSWVTKRGACRKKEECLVLDALEGNLPEKGNTGRHVLSTTYF